MFEMMQPFYIQLILCLPAMVYILRLVDQKLGESILQLEIEEGWRVVNKAPPEAVDAYTKFTRRSRWVGHAATVLVISYLLINLTSVFWLTPDVYYSGDTLMAIGLTLLVFLPSACYSWFVIAAGTVQHKRLTVSYLGVRLPYVDMVKIFTAYNYMTVLSSGMWFIFAILK